MINAQRSTDPTFAVRHKVASQDVDYEGMVDGLLIDPLLSGGAYYANILDFCALHSHALASRYDEGGLSRELIHGYVNDYNVGLAPYVVQFEFRYQTAFLENLKGLFKQMSNHCGRTSPEAEDLRVFDGSCVAFGDFSLSYIEKEGWYGIRDAHWDFFEAIRLEHSRMMASKLKRMSSYLYFDFVDSDEKTVVGLYSDFRDYSLVSYEDKPIRKISKLLLNTHRHTLATYQVEPLSPIALSYHSRLFFLVRERAEENIYAFIIFLSEEEMGKISTIKTWACAER